MHNGAETTIGEWKFDRCICDRRKTKPMSLLLPPPILYFRRMTRADSFDAIRSRLLSLWLAESLSRPFAELGKTTEFPMKMRLLWLSELGEQYTTSLLLNGAAKKPSEDISRLIRVWIVFANLRLRRWPHWKELRTECQNNYGRNWRRRPVKLYIKLLHPTFNSLSANGWTISFTDGFAHTSSHPSGELNVEERLATIPLDRNFGIGGIYWKILYLHNPRTQNSKENNYTPRLVCDSIIFRWQAS